VGETPVLLARWLGVNTAANVLVVVNGVMFAGTCAATG